MVQWLGLQVFSAEGLGSVPGWRTRIPQARWHWLKKKTSQRHKRELSPASSFFFFLIILCIYLATLGLSHNAQANLPHTMWDLSSLTRIETHIPSIGRGILSHWIIREVPLPYFFFLIKKKFSF